MNVDGKKIVVVGTGVSGIGAVKLLAQTGAIITLYDGNEKLAESDVRAKLTKDCEVRIILGEMPPEYRLTARLSLLLKMQE